MKRTETQSDYSVETGEKQTELLQYIKQKATSGQPYTLVLDSNQSALESSFKVGTTPAVELEKIFPNLESKSAEFISLGLRMVNLTDLEKSLGIKKSSLPDHYLDFNRSPQDYAPKATTYNVWRVSKLSNAFLHELTIVSENFGNTTYRALTLNQPEYSTKVNKPLNDLLRNALAFRPLRITT